MIYNFIIQFTIVLVFTILEIVQTPLLIHQTDRLMSNLGFTICHIVSVLKVTFFMVNRNALKNMADMLEIDMLKYRQEEKYIKSAIHISVGLLFMFVGIVCVVCTCGSINSVADHFIFIENVNFTRNVSIHLPFEVSTINLQNLFSYVILYILYKQ